MTQLGNARWHGARADVLKQLAEACGITPETPAPRPPGGDDQAAYVFLAGLTAVADWVGSNEQDFPPVGNPAVARGEVTLSGYAAEAEVRAVKALDRLGWRHKGQPSKSVTFVQLFKDVLKGREPRALQELAERIGNESRGPSPVLIEAPMGEGKTEEAWYWSSPRLWG